MHGKLKIARILIQYSADVNSPDIDGWTPLHAAANNGDVGIVPLLLGNGADLHATQREGFTALHFASTLRKGTFETIQLLLEQGANVHIWNVHGMTPYQRALRFGRQEIAQFLLAHDSGGV